MYKTIQIQNKSGLKYTAVLSYSVYSPWQCEIGQKFRIKYLTTKHVVPTTHV